jgi:prolipoprotein diacylglyceryltransferase
LGPAIPSIPSQALEAIATAIVLVVVVLASFLPQLRRADGRLFLVATAGWALGRAVVASTWRDPPVAGSFRTEQVIDVAVAVGAVALAVVLVAVQRGRATASDVPDGPRAIRPG